MKQIEILVAGSIMNDLVLSIDRIPREGESYIGNGYRNINGGKGANQAVACARLGAGVTFCGKIGNDAVGIRLKNAMQNEGIDVSFLQTADNALTGLAVIMLEKNGHNRIIVNPEANSNLVVEDIEAVFKKTYDLVLVDFEIPPVTVVEVCEQAKKRNIPVVVDAGPAQKFRLELLKGLDILTPNETEAYALTGIEITSDQTAQTAARELMRMSEAKYVVIKLGEKGAMLYDGKESKFFPPIPTDVKDTTAAGDAFTAAMAVEYAISGNIRKAIKLGNIAGGLAVSKIGAQPSLPYIDDVAKILALDSEKCDMNLE